MKNICLILTETGGFPFERRLRALRAFEAAGYEFPEVRCVCAIDGDSAARAVGECWKEAENLAVLACGIPVKGVASALSAMFEQGKSMSSANGESAFTDGEKCLFLLSSDGENYVKEVCIPILQKKYGRRIASIVLRFVGVEDGRMQELLQRARAYAKGLVTIRRENRFGEDVLRIFYDESTPRMLTDDLLRFFLDNLSDNVYAMEDVALEKQLVELLKIRRKKIAVAESFTGGGVGKRIVSVSGASEVYREGLNTYSEEAKMRRLGVTEFTLRSQGAVSEQTAYEMAAGLLERGDCDVSIATTGIAGPNGDGTGVPIGTCCIAVGIDQSVYVYRYTLQGDREEVTETAIVYALFLACRQLKNM